MVCNTIGDRANSFRANSISSVPQCKWNSTVAENPMPELHVLKAVSLQASSYLDLWTECSLEAREL